MRIVSRIVSTSFSTLPIREIEIKFRINKIRNRTNIFFFRRNIAIYTRLYLIYKINAKRKSFQILNYRVYFSIAKNCFR